MSLDDDKVREPQFSKALIIDINTIGTDIDVLQFWIRGETYATGKLMAVHVVTDTKLVEAMLILSLELSIEGGRDRSDSGHADSK